jgi:hypothetical protein
MGNELGQVGELVNFSSSCLLMKAFSQLCVHPLIAQVSPEFCHSLEPHIS